MYSYTWDEETGGLLLNTTPLVFSKEPRPVYYEELDLLGFDKHWHYAKDDSYPYMWAEANNYYYRGRLVAKTKGGSLYTAPELILMEEPEPDGGMLRFVDVPRMVQKNKEIMDSLVQETIKKIYNTYVEYKDKIDVFYVAFSGGKDSVVTLDLVKRALPNTAFKVLFGDTGMEFPDTYTLVKSVEEQCKEEEISFIRAKSELEPLCTWNQFGPPSKSMRWCCSVHKTSPQILSLRKILNKDNFTGMAFVGVRASESFTRSEYEYISDGKKHRGQYSFNPILEWNSAELYIYLFCQKLSINAAYIKGNSRAGCLLCPNVTDRSAFLRRSCYTKEVNQFIEVIRQSYSNTILSESKFKEFMEKTGWKARLNGRDLSNKVNCVEEDDSCNVLLKVKNPRTDWREWIKTIGVLLNDNSPYCVMHKGNKYFFSLEKKDDGYIVSIKKDDIKRYASFYKLLKNVFHKASSCIGCHECEADCHNGCISFVDGAVHINENCIHCYQCHKASDGCLMYNSLRLPKGVNGMQKKSLNRYSTHGPKMEWLQQFFEFENDFSEKHSLGSQMLVFFKAFLKDAGLMEGDSFSSFAAKLKNIGFKSNSFWGLLFINLSYSIQVGWFVKNLNFDEEYSREFIEQELIDAGCNERAASDSFKSYQRFLALPFADVGYGIVNAVEKKKISVRRIAWLDPDPRVILYSLYKFAEACDGYYQFTVTYLMDTTIERNGISPSEIFGIAKDDLIKILNGLSVNYPEFISVKFTHDLDTIVLNGDKKALDVLQLF